MIDEATPGDDGELRRQLGRLVQALLQDVQSDGEPIEPIIRAHLGVEDDQLPILTEELESWDLANLQLALQAAAGREGWELRVLGVAGQGRRFSIFGLSELLTDSGYGVGPPEYVNAPVGPGETLACLDFAVLLVTSPDGPLCAFVRRGDDHGGGPALSVQAAAPEPGLAARFLADLRALITEHDVFRGQLLTVEVTRHGEPRLVFLERPVMSREDLVLPEGTLERIERHVVGPTRHREALRASGRHLARGLLLWGPPGSGKTHTVRYLTARLDRATVIILSGGSLGMVGAFGALARRLAPSVVILEDVDLVAQERGFGPYGQSPALFELMNEMSGLGDDADVAFILTTNRPDTLEPALAARPGRVDLAVEVPLPDAEARRRLLALYARGLNLRLADPGAVVRRTEGVTASFIRELLRKAALATLERGTAEVTDADVDDALDELLSETGAITRLLLGGIAPDGRLPGGGQATPPQHEWMEHLPEAGD